MRNALLIAFLGMMSSGLTILVLHRLRRQIMLDQTVCMAPSSNGRNGASADGIGQSLSVLIPARNEEGNIDPCLRSVLAQDVNAMEVLVLDDASTDATYVRAASVANANPRVRILRGQDPPSGWAGKPHALHQLASAATGDWLLFLDADTVHHPGSLAAGLHYAQQNQLDALSCIGDRPSRSFWDRVWEPLWPCVLYFLIGALSKLGSPGSRHDFASGAWFLISRRALHDVGGIAAVRHHLVEDCALAGTLRTAGLRMRVVNAPQLYTLQMYRSLLELIQGWSKNAYPIARMLGYGPAKVLLLLSALFLITLLPFCVAVAGLAGLLPDLSPLGRYGPALVALAASLGIRVSRKSDPSYFWTLPLSGALAIAVFANSMLRHTTGAQLRWKDRLYDGRSSLPQNPKSPIACALDTLMAGVDLEHAPAWITLACRVTAPLDAQAARRALHALVAETERLRLKWDPNSSGWIPIERQGASLDAALRVQVDLDSEDAIIARVIRQPIDWAHELPFQIHLCALQQSGAPAWLLVFQLHHLAGDACALRLIISRFWQFYAGRRTSALATGIRHLTDGQILRRAFSLRALRHLFRASSRLTAARGLALSSNRGPLGDPNQLTLRIPLARAVAHLPHASELFYGGLLTAIVHYEQGRHGLLRFQVPVDLRRALGRPRQIENACTCVPIEFSLDRLRAQGAEVRGRLFRDALGLAVRSQVHWGTALESWLLTRLIATSRIREAAHNDLLNTTRSSTLVVSYLGCLDSLFREAPVRPTFLRGHTPTWGATAFTYDGSLYINLTAFSGLWSSETMAAFGQLIEQAIERILHGVDDE